MNLLLVSNEPRVLRALSAALELDYDVHVAETESEAKLIASQLGDAYAVIVDETIAEIPSFDLFTWCEARTPRVRNLLLTSLPVKQSSGVSTHKNVQLLRKPWNIAEIQSALTSVVFLNRVEKDNVTPFIAPNVGDILVIACSDECNEFYAGLGLDIVNKLMFFDSVDEFLISRHHHSQVSLIVLDIGSIDLSEFQEVSLRYPKTKILIKAIPKIIRGIRDSISVYDNVEALAKPYSATRLMASIRSLGVQFKAK